ncbi:MAG: DUF4169 family protein [Rhodospirillaceae bacterium]|nr:DUF4169 family protein [Rhodospirillaceae bacterium]
MAETVSLSKFRKIKAKEQKEKRAAENRVAFGRTKQEKTLDDKVRKMDQEKITAKKRERPTDDK